MSKGYGPGPLSRREREVADLVRQGLTDEEIAKRLYLSKRTVEGYVLSGRNKVGAANRVALGVYMAGLLTAARNSSS